VTLDFLDGMSSWAPIRFPSGVDEWIRKVFDYSVEESLEICDVLGLRHILAVGASKRRRGDGAAHRHIRSILRASGQVRSLGRLGAHADARHTQSEDGTGDYRKVGAKNSGIMLDTWHFMRAGADFPLLRSLPAGAISDVQVVDATTTAAVGPLGGRGALSHVPGEGELPLLEILVSSVQRVASVLPGRRCSRTKRMG